MTTDDEGVRPVPDAARHGTAKPSRKARRKARWRTVKDWSVPDYAAMPDKTHRTITHGNLRLTIVKRGARWTVLCRTEIPSSRLAGLPSAPCLPVEGVEHPAGEGDR